MPPRERRLTLTLAGHAVSVAAGEPEGPAGLVVLAHGRVNDLNHESLAAAGEGAAEAGWAWLRFNFPYRERGCSAPDPFATLVAVHAAAAQAGLADLGLGPDRLVLAGKSLGARTAVEAVRRGVGPRPAALLCLGYPLHPPGRPEEKKDGPLIELTLPLLFLQGQFDDLGRPELLVRTLDKLRAPAKLVIVPGCDHGFGPVGDDGRPRPESLNLIRRSVAEWLAGLGERR